MTDMFSNKTALKALETYGTNFEIWPDQELARFVQNDARFEPHIKRGLMLDAELASHSTPAPSELLKSRILKAAAASPQIQGSVHNQPATNENQTTVNRAPRPARFSGFARMAALFLVCAIVGGSIWMSNTPTGSQQQYTAELEAETDIWLGAANDLDMIDIFLWVETDEG